MKKLLNTLFVTTPGTYLCKEGETVIVRVERQTRLQLPIHTISGIVCFGQVSCSPQLMHLCAEYDVLLSFMSEHGRFLARVQGPVSGNVLLRRAQYRQADCPEQTAQISRSVLVGKIANSRSVLMRTARENAGTPASEALSVAAESLGRMIQKLDRTPGLNELRGTEGEAASCYFGVFDHLILAQKNDFKFTVRSRRPPLDKTNALLSFVYSLLAHDVTSALEGVGLDPSVGFLHRDRPGRPGLALDMMEEFRPFIGDRLALTLINRGQVKPKGFRETETGAVLMDEATRKELLMAYQKRKQEEINHPFLKEKVPIGLLPHCQAMLFARHLRGDLDGYPPFVWR